MLIERDTPLELLAAAARRAASGHGSVAIIGGEAGIGKSSLLQSFAYKTAPGHSMFWGGCEALFTPRPLGPLRDIAGSLDPKLAKLLDDGAPPDRLFPALLGGLQNARFTSVLIFEDVHWADTATLDLIKYLGRRMPLLKAMLVLSLRSDEVGPGHPLTQVLGDLPAQAVTRIDLKPLSAEGVAKLMGGAGGGRELYEITGGNPFFVTELLARNDAKSGLPASIRDAVWSRISRLGEAERRAVETLSIVPGAIEPWLAAGLAGEGAAALIDACVRNGMLVRDEAGDLRFRHELARQATLDRLAMSEQVALHAKAENLMAARGGVPLSRRVHHAAGAGDGPRVLELAPKAAAEAAGAGAHLQAASLLAMALRHAGGAPAGAQAQLNEDWSYEAALALKIDDTIIAARRKAVELWRGLGRRDKVGLNLRWLSRLHWYRGEADLATTYIEQALAELEAVPSGPERASAYAARAQMFMLHDRVDEAIYWGRRAIALAEELGETETRVHALNTVGTALVLSGRDGGQELLEESLADALKHGFHEQAARAYTNYGEYAVLFKKFKLAERLVSEGIAFDTSHDLDAWTHYLVGRQALLRMEQGLFREAEAVARGVMGLERLTLLMKLPALNVLGRVLCRLGEPGADELLQRALTDGLATSEPQYITPARFALAEAAWLNDEPEAAHDHLLAAAAMDLRNFDPWELGELAVWWKRCGVPEPLVRDLSKAAGPRLAELDGDPLAAAEQWRELGLPYEAGLSLIAANTGEALAKAVAILEPLEAKPAAALARGRAAAIGFAGALPKARRGPYAAARTHPLGLTAKELEVLNLLAEGLSNQVIASRLGRSPRTVEHHVSAVLAKFNAQNRMDIVLRLRGEPWLLSVVN